MANEDQEKKHGQLRQGNTSINGYLRSGYDESEVMAEIITPEFTKFYESLPTAGSGSSIESNLTTLKMNLAANFTRAVIPTSILSSEENPRGAESFGDILDRIRVEAIFKRDHRSDPDEAEKTDALVKILDTAIIYCEKILEPE